MDYPQNVEQFKALVAEIQNEPTYRAPVLYGIGRRLVTPNGTIASVRYPVVSGPGQNTGTAAILLKVLGIKPEGVQTLTLHRRKVQEALEYFKPFENDGKVHDNIDALKDASNFPGSDLGVGVVTFIFDDVAPEGVEDSTLKLYALSNRLFKPNALNLIGIFGKLPNVVWEKGRPLDAEEVRNRLRRAAFGDEENVPDCVDKFPLYVDHIRPIDMGVRILDRNSVRLGAYLGHGTVVMHGGYVNFNAGTLGISMVEGLIASSATVGEGSDIGNGAKMIGVLSGGNTVPMSVGRNCLLELNSTLGIPIGDATIIATGTAVMAGSKVWVQIQGHPMHGTTVKGRDLAGISAATFRRDDENGRLEVVRTERNEEFARKLKDGETILNRDLHVNT